MVLTETAPERQGPERGTFYYTCVAERGVGLRTKIHFSDGKTADDETVPDTDKRPGPNKGEVVKVVEKNKPVGSDEITFLRVAPEGKYPQGGWVFDLKLGKQT